MLHSGTAGAALAGALHGIRGVAVSARERRAAALGHRGRRAQPVLAWAAEHGRTDRVLNLNVPDLPVQRVRGLRQAPLAGLGAVQATVEASDGAVRLTYADVETFAGADATPDTGPQLDPGRAGRGPAGP